MSPFSAATIPRFHAIYVTHTFDGDPDPIRKWFVILNHVGSVAICLKATHHTQVYENNPVRMAGCVYFKAGEVACFAKNSAIQPDNRFAIKHSIIEQDKAAGTLRIQAMPADFLPRLQQAIKDHDNLNGKERAGLNQMIS